MNAINNALDPKDNTVRVKWDIQITTWDIDKVKNSNDLVKNFTYLDTWTDDERVNTIVYSSASLVLSFTETFTYAWVSWAYRVSNITTS